MIRKDEDPPEAAPGASLDGCGAVGIATPTSGGRAEETPGLGPLRVHPAGLIDFQFKPLPLGAVLIDGGSCPFPSRTAAFRGHPGEHRISAEFEDCLHRPSSRVKTKEPEHGNAGAVPKVTADQGPVDYRVYRASGKRRPQGLIRVDQDFPRGCSTWNIPGEVS